MHNNSMLEREFITDIAVEAAEQSKIATLSQSREIGDGIIERVLNVKNNEQSRQIGREKGVYITYDCQAGGLESQRVCASLTANIAHAARRLLGNLRRNSPVLVIGLGNADIIADALGERTVKGIRVTNDLDASFRQSVCAFSTGVPDATGIATAELAAAITDRIKPSAVILVDSLATGNVSRVGASFQLSTAGITPGSGVGQDKSRLDRSVLGVPVLAIGVPLMVSLKTAVYAVVSDYCNAIGADVNDFKLRAMLSERHLSKLVVAPKDIDAIVTLSASVISSALNRAFA